jgi:hypothetical protein
VAAAVTVAAASAAAAVEGLSRTSGLYTICIRSSFCLHINLNKITKYHDVSLMYKLQYGKFKRAVRSKVSSSIAIRLQTRSALYNKVKRAVSSEFLSQDSSIPAGSGAGGDLRANRSSAQPSTTRGRPRELNLRRTAAPARSRRRLATALWPLTPWR